MSTRASLDTCDGVILMQHGLTIRTLETIRVDTGLSDYPDWTATAVGVICPPSHRYFVYGLKDLKSLTLSFRGQPVEIDIQKTNVVPDWVREKWERIASEEEAQIEEEKRLGKTPSVSIPTPPSEWLRVQLEKEAEWRRTWW